MTIQDLSQVNRALTVTNVVDSTSSPLRGLKSGIGSGSCVLETAVADAMFDPSLSHTIEFNIRATGAPSPNCYLAGVNNGWDYLRMDADGTIYATNVLETEAIAETDFLTKHIAVVYDYSLNQVRTYINGVMRQTVAAIAPSSITPKFGVLNIPDAGQTPFNVGILDNVRYTKAIRYTSDFTPPTTLPTDNSDPFWNDVALLIDFEDTVITPPEPQTPPSLKTPVVARIAGIDTKALFQPISGDRVGR